MVDDQCGFSSNCGWVDMILCPSIGVEHNIKVFLL